MKWLWLPVAVLMAVMPALPARAAEDETYCDLEDIRHYPMAEVLRTRVFPLNMPHVYFPDPDEDRAYEITLDAAGALRRRAALARAIESFAPEERQVVMLAAISDWTASSMGLGHFFIRDESVFIKEVLETLYAEGLEDHAALVHEGMALFGSSYGTHEERYYRWTDGHGTIRDPALGDALRDLGERFRRLPDLLDIALGRIENSPGLTAIYEPLRADTPDEDRFFFLTRGLRSCLDHYDPPPEVAARLAAMPEPYARIAVVDIFEAEMLNGSVHQFFFNSSGVLAPDVVEALTAMGLPAHAKAVQQGINMFPDPYPRDVSARRDFMLAQDEDFDEALYALTYIVDDGAMHEAMIELAHEAGIMPR